MGRTKRGIAPPPPNTRSTRRKLITTPESSPEALPETSPAMAHSREDEQAVRILTDDLNLPPTSTDTTYCGVSVKQEMLSEQGKLTGTATSTMSAVTIDLTEIDSESELSKMEEDLRERMRVVAERQAELKKKKEEEERLRKEEEERKRKEEEERKKKEEEERKKKEEEERKKKEEEERKKKEEEERKRKAEEERKKREEEEEERRKKAEEEERVRKETEEKRLEDEGVRKKALEKKAKELEDQKKELAQKKGKGQVSEPAKGTQTRMKAIAHKKQKVKDAGSGSGPTSPRSPATKNSATEQGNSPFSETESLLHDSGSESSTPMARQSEVIGKPRTFTSPAAAQQYAILLTRKINMEKGFEDKFLAEHAFVREKIEAYSWGTLAQASRRANASHVREFFAEAAHRPTRKVYVRGVLVRYDNDTITRVLGLKRPDSCALTTLKSNLSVETRVEMATTLCIQGKSWVKKKGRDYLPAGSLTIEAAIWFNFLRHNLWPTSHDTTISVDKCCLLYCVIKNLPVDIGHLMSLAIFQVRKRKKVNIPFPCLITALTLDAGVATVEEDLWINTATTIGSTTIKRRVAHEEASASAHSDSMTEVLKLLRENNELLNSIQDRMKMMEKATEAVWSYTRERDEVIKAYFAGRDPEVSAAFPQFPDDVCPVSGEEASDPVDEEMAEDDLLDESSD